MSTPFPENPLPFLAADPRVLAVYFVTIGVWTTASGHDFISSTWKSVRDTRRMGLIHLYYVAGPMIFIFLYIHFQRLSGDYKELGSALVALTFALIHISRTIMGLWQLHTFKQWTLSSIKSMESLGFETRLSENTAAENDSDDEGDDHGSDGHGLPSRVYDFCKWVLPFTLCLRNDEEARIERIADDILVNNTLIDNRLSDVHTVCYLHLLSVAEWKNVKKEKHTVARILLLLRYGIENSLRLVGVLLSPVLKIPLDLNAESGPCIIPRNPESVGLRWATTLVAQVGWTIDMAALKDPVPTAEYDSHRNHFAEQILLSAALHTQRMSIANANTTTNQDDLIAGFLPFKEWRNYPKLCSGQFCKQEFLRRACKTGRGLPYHVAHSKAVERPGGVKRYGYRNFASEIRRARESLPAEIESRAESFDVDRLEWFMIFISVENWTPGYSPVAAEERRIESSGDDDSDDSFSNSDSVLGVKQTRRTENDIPIENLKKQLGLHQHPSFISDESKLPFLRNVSRAILWGNRNVLETSCHIDNWISLCAGEQSAYTVEHIPWMKRKTITENELSQQSAVGVSSVSDNDFSIDNEIRESVEFEKCKLFCQMVTLHPEHFHFEKSFSFLGCSMEMLRSSMAKWVESHEHCDEESWKPHLFSNDRRKHLDRFEGSPDFTACLRSLKCVFDMSKRFVKMRILWELQNHVQNRLQNGEAAPGSTAAVALCILSFPAVSMDVRDKENIPGAPEVVEGTNACTVQLQHGNGEQFQVRSYEYVIRATCGPQDLQLVLSFGATEGSTNVWVSMYLCENEVGSVSSFDWEAWRNSFYGQLEACRRWKQNIGFPSVPLVPQTQNIASGIRRVAETNNAEGGTRYALQTWNGWLPHCASICMYEMTTSGFIREARNGKSFSLSVGLSDLIGTHVEIPQQVWEPVDYANASAESFEKASLQAQEWLPYASDNRTPEIEDTLLARDLEENVSLALLALETAAIEERSLSALEKAMSILLCDGRKSVMRGVMLLEKFYTGGEKATLQAIQEFCGNNEHTQFVTSLFEKLFKFSLYDRQVAIRYYSFLMVTMSYGGHGTRENALSVMLRSSINRCYSMSTVEAAASAVSFSFNLSDHDFEELATLYLLFSNILSEAYRTRARASYSRSTLQRLNAYGARTKSNLSFAIETAAATQAGGNALEQLRICVDQFL